MKVIIIGGGTLGTSCAFHLRKLNKKIDITILEKTNNLDYSQCSLPYLISDEVVSEKEIFPFSKSDFKRNNIEIVLGSEVKNIDRSNKLVITDSNKYSYDYVVLCTGSKQKFPNIKGVENTLSFNSIEDYHLLNQNLKNRKIKNISVIGSGLIGVELAVSLNKIGINVNLIESEDYLLPSIIDSNLSKDVEKYLKSLGINLFFNSNVKEIKKDKVILDEKDLPSGLIFSCTGLKPNISLAKKIGLNVKRGIIVDDYLKTSDPNIFSGGDCALTKNGINNEFEVSMLGTKAVRCAKTIAENILSCDKKYNPFLNSTITKIGDKYLGAVGFNSRKSKIHGINPISATFESKVSSEYFKSNDKIKYNMVANKSGKLIGCQVFSDVNVSGRINTISVAIKNNMSVNSLSNVETCYNPGSAPIFDPMINTSEILSKKIRYLNKNGL